MTGVMMKGAATRALAGGREYATRRELHRAAQRAEARTGWVLVDILDGALPDANDAAGWDDYRRARGLSGCHH